MKRAMMARALAAGLLAGGGGVAVAEGVGALGHIRAGEWQIREVGEKTAPRVLCVADTRRLLQIQHGAAACAFRTIADEPNAATVRYACPGAGNGTTELTVESAAILRLHTQGVQRGAPFDATYEARFVGPCRTGLADR